MEHHVQAALFAASRGDRPVVEEHVTQGRAGCSDEEGSTLLMYAAASGREEVVELLLRNQADVDAVNVYGWSALMQACCYNHLNSVLILLRYKADFNLHNKWKTTALTLAAHGGYVGIVDALLQEGAGVNRQEVVDALTPLMAAAQCGHEAVISQLLNRGANVHTRLVSSNLNALALAAINNQLPVVKLLLKHGADKDSLDINGAKAVNLAAAFKHSSVVQLLGGSESKVFTKTQLFEAVKSGNVAKVTEILASKRELASSADKDGLTQLMFAANKGSKEVSQLLVSGIGRTGASHLLIWQVCEVLLGAGAEVNACDGKNGWTALMLATHKKRYEVVKLLGEQGADVHIKGRTGNSAYDIANMIGDVAMLRTITDITIQSLQRGAMPSLARGGSGSLDEEPGTPTAAVGGRESGSGTVERKESGKPEGGRGGGGGVGSDTKQEKTDQPALIDMAELKRRMQSAYRTTGTPTLSLNIAGDPPPTINTPEPRFPMSRVRGLSPTTSRPVAKSAPASPQGSMNHSSGSLTSGNSSAESPPRKSFLPTGNGGRGSPGRPDRLFAPNRGSSALSRSNPNKPTGGGGVAKAGLFPLSRTPLLSPQAEGNFRLAKSGGTPPSRRIGGVAGGVAPTVQSYRMQMYRGGGGGRERDNVRLRLDAQPVALTKKVSPRSIRSRSSTDPPSMHHHLPRVPLQRKSSLPRYSQAGDMDLRTVLEQADLGRFYSVLEAQDIDYGSFVTLTDTEFMELGVADEGDRRQLMELIDDLNAGSLPGALKQNHAPVFVYH